MFLRAIVIRKSVRCETFDPFPGFPIARRTAMAEGLKQGDKVKWSSHGGDAHGQVLKRVTTPTKIKSHKVAASRENPQFIVETKEGKKAAHKAEALKKEK
jgi:Hypervirulence associated proteins TUDOR domain